MIRIFYAEGNKKISDFIKKMMDNVFGKSYFLEFLSVEDNLERIITKGSHDVYLIGENIGNAKGLDIIGQFAGKIFNKPFIYISSSSDCEEDLYAMEVGTTDYLPIDELTERLFERTIRYAIKSKIMEKEMHDRQIELMQQEKKLSLLNSAKDKMLAIIGHDIRGPVGVISQLVEFIITEKMDDESRHNFLTDIKVQSLQTIDLLDNLLYWSKSQQNQLEPKPQKLNIKKIIDMNMELFCRNAKMKQIQLTKKVKNPLYVNADREMMNLVLRNLLSNAIKFTSLNGSIELSAYQQGDKVMVSVSDTGMGMNANLIDAVLSGNNQFSSMGSNNEKGSGLGLKLCKDFIDLHNGKLSISSIPGSGTKVIFSLMHIN